MSNHRSSALFISSTLSFHFGLEIHSFDEVFFLLSLSPVCLITLLEMIANSDQLCGLEFDCNQETTLVQGVRPLIDFNQNFI